MIVWELLNYRTGNVIGGWEDERTARQAVAEMLRAGGQMALDGLTLAALENDDDSGDRDSGPVLEGEDLIQWALQTSSSPR